MLAPHQPFAPRLNTRYPLPPGQPGSMVGGPWIIDANFQSKVYVKNMVETFAVSVSPILYLSNGAVYQLPDLQMDPSGTSVLDIGASLQRMGIAPYATLSGAIELKYNWPWDPICATVRNLDTTHSLIFSYGLNSSKAPDLPGMSTAASASIPRIIEGEWWKQETNVTGFVSLINTTSRQLAASVMLSDSTGGNFSQQEVVISPHGSKMVSLLDLATAKTAMGGVRIAYTGAMTDLLVNGGLEDVGVGYSANLPFTTAPASSKQSTVTVAELGLMTGPADRMMHFPAGTTFAPYTVLRNVSNNPVSAAPTIWWMAGGFAKSFPLPPLSLQPYQTEMLDLPSLLTQAGLANYSGNIQLT